MKNIERRVEKELPICLYTSEQVVRTVAAPPLIVVKGALQLLNDRYRKIRLAHMSEFRLRVSSF